MWEKRAGDRGQGTGDRGQGTGDRGQGTGDRGQGTGDRGQGTGDRGQGTGDRGQGTGDRGQGTGDRGQGTGLENSKISYLKRHHNLAVDDRVYDIFVDICCSSTPVQRTPPASLSQGYGHNEVATETVEQSKEGSSNHGNCLWAPF